MIKYEVNKNKVPAITLEMEGTEKDLANEAVNMIYGMYRALYNENQQDAILFKEDVSKALRLDGSVWLLADDRVKGMTEKQILAVVKMPGEKPRVEPLFENSLEAFQAAVGGYIEAVTVAEDLVLIVNEEGRLQNLPFNCRVPGYDLVGTVVAVGVKGEEFCSLSPSALKAALEMLGGEDG